MTPMSFDLAVLGGGSAGFAAAIKAAELGARVALIEGGTLGGTCVNVGCVPSKTLLRAAEAHYRRAHHGFSGVPNTDGQPEWTLIRAQKDELVGDLRQAKYSDVLGAYQAIALFQERGTLASAGVIHLAGGTVIRASKVIVATGSSPWAPPIPGLAEAGYLDNASAMALASLPRSLIVIGAGSVGLELGQLFARVGVSVTLLEAQSRVAPAEDPEVGEALGHYLRSEGLDVRTGVQVEQVTRAESGYTVSLHEGGRPQALQADQLLIATGRRPNTSGLGLERLGVSVGDRAGLAVSDHLQTAHPSIYAAGDVLGDPMLVYVAAYGGSVAAENAILGNKRRYDLAALPRVTFTDPAIGSVGLSEAEARARGIEPLIAKLPLDQVPRALAAREIRGFIKLLADPRSRQIIGAQVLAQEAGELMAEATLAVRFYLRIEDITSTFHPYLTLSEGIKLAAQTFDRDVKTLSCCAA
jgi:mercuric reductase